MLTYTGQKVTLANAQAPKLKDIAIHLGRASRFGGALRVWWTVLHHSMAAGELAFTLYENDTTTAYALLHDAHEAWMQQELDLRIYHRFGLALPTTAMSKRVKLVDKALLAAEARLVGPPKTNPESDTWAFPTAETVGMQPDDAPNKNIEKEALHTVKYTYLDYPKPEDTVYPNSPAVRDYMRLVRNTLKRARSDTRALL